MSGICQQRVSRRQFLKSGLALAAGVVMLGPRSVLGEGRDECARWAFLSDTHISADPDNHFRGFYPYRNLQEITSQLACDPPEGLVITGDLARLKGRPEAYANLKTLLAPLTEKRPVYLGLGNHDNRDDFFRTLGDSHDSGEAVSNKHVVVADAGPIRLIVLDTLLHINRGPGMLGGSQRTWLETYLRTCDDRPTILFFHHTPKVDLLDTGRLFRIIGPMTKVKAVVYGHTHHVKFSQFKGIHLVNLPAAGFNFSDSQPVGWMDAKLTSKGGEFRLRAMGGNTRVNGLTTKLTWRS